MNLNFKLAEEDLIAAQQAVGNQLSIVCRRIFRYPDDECRVILSSGKINGLIWRTVMSGKADLSLKPAIIKLFLLSVTRFWKQK